jgi:hypothetical protein
MLAEYVYIHAYIQEERIRLKAMVAGSDENMYGNTYILHTYRKREFA